MQVRALKQEKLLRVTGGELIIAEYVEGIIKENGERKCMAVVNSGTAGSACCLCSNYIKENRGNTGKGN